MKHEKIIKDERGKVVIIISLWISDFFASENIFRYDCIVEHTPPGKRKGINTPDIATEEEILQAKMELWNKIKPF